MAKLEMERKAADNKYLHRDFHISADNGVEYVGKKYGDAGVNEFLTQFAKAYYIPLVKEYQQIGLIAIKNYIEKLYKIEEAEDAIEIILIDNVLSVKVRYCPALKYMKAQGKTPSKWYEMTTRIVYNQLAKDCGLKFYMSEYDVDTGATEYSFSL